MKFLVFSPPGGESRPGVIDGEEVVALPFTDLEELIAGGQPALEVARGLAASHPPGGLGMDGRQAVWPLAEVSILAPLSHPPNFRDFYAFETHVANAWANRGQPVPPAWYRLPVFYFSNPHSLIGPDVPVRGPAASQALDFELEVACIIGRSGRDIPAAEAPDHIFGFSILNDWSARDLQREEMSVGLGPAKGKDFASSLGPWIITPDELTPYATTRPGVYDLEMVARINGQERSRGNWQDIHYSFGELIARASADVELLPGDLIGSGTVGTGCLLELTRGQGPWLQPGDEVELEIQVLGRLRNQVDSH